MVLRMHTSQVHVSSRQKLQVIVSMQLLVNQQATFQLALRDPGLAIRLGTTVADLGT